MKSYVTLLHTGVLVDAMLFSFVMQSMAAVQGQKGQENHDSLLVWLC